MNLYIMKLTLLHKFQVVRYLLRYHHKNSYRTELQYSEGKI